MTYLVWPGLGISLTQLINLPDHAQTPPAVHERQVKYRQLIYGTLRADVVGNIRHCTSKGLILGTETFRRQFEQLTGDTPG